MKVTQFRARKILDATGSFTLEVEVGYKEFFGFGSAPIGTSESTAAKVSLNKDLDAVIKELNNKIPKLIDGNTFSKVDDIIAFETKVRELDLGSLPTLSTSYALLDMLAHFREIPKWRLFSPYKQHPILLNKMIGGGAHFRRGPKIQEFLVFNNAKDTIKSLEINKKVFDAVGKLLDYPSFDYEYGWAPQINDKDAFDTVSKAVASVQSNYTEKISMGVDVAANTLFVDGRYNDMPVDRYAKWLEDAVKQYNLAFIEDPYNEEDWANFNSITSSMKNKLIVGDDLFATNPVRLMKGNDRGACNAAIVKPNQVGSLGETLEFVQLAKKFNYTTVASHRSRETNDNTIAHIAMGLHLPYFKISIGSGERVCKINELIRY